MSVYTERATLSLFKMVIEMERKHIELGRIIKCVTQLMMSGVSPYAISRSLKETLLDSQNDDGGFVANTDTIWGTKFLSYFSEYSDRYVRAIKWLRSNIKNGCLGRSIRDMPRIPVTGTALYLLPNLDMDNKKMCQELEKLWLSECNSLTYKAAYTLMAFKACQYVPKKSGCISETMQWLCSQQEADGGFSPWKGHPVGSNIYCTGVACIGLLSYCSRYNCEEVLSNAYNYMVKSQLVNGIWAYHELEDGSAWGLRAMTEIERERGIV